MSGLVVISNTILKESLTDVMAYRGKAANIDVLTKGGYYLTDNTTTSATPLPVSLFQGILEVLERSGGALQRFSPTNATSFYQRFYSFNSSSWSAWYKFAGTIVS
ncbi:MAG: pyocin knob domain-containing protein [Muribaculaceae bacterium]|nr:pyocin knob domain-containing protein [Muribaculaceae bacterium]